MGSIAIDTLMKGYAALAARDEERLMGCLDEDVELRTMTGTYRGHDGIRRWILDMDEGWTPWTLTIEDVRELGDSVLIQATLEGHSSRTDIAMSHSFWVVWQVRGGRAALGIHFDDREQALQVARSGAV